MPLEPSTAPVTFRLLNTRLARASVRAFGAVISARARTRLAGYLARAEQAGHTPEEVADALASGATARALADQITAEITTASPALVRDIACRSGCAWCCIFLEGDGGLITEAEARGLYAALAPLSGQRDGRSWHPKACAALDPVTRNCRAYDTRPMICRSFISTDAEACRENAEGGDAEGSGTIGSQVDYLALLALSRDILRGRRRLATYSLEALARAASDGVTAEAALAAARHAPRELRLTCEDFADSI